jgi:hypothetical protein
VSAWALSGMDGLVGLGVVCENCGRRRRLNRQQIQALGGENTHTVEQIALRLKCRVCAEQGKVSKNISIVPYYKAEKAEKVTPYERPSASSQGTTR